MATLAQLQDQVNNITTAVAAVGTKVQTVEASLTGTIGSADSDALLASLETIATSLQAIANPPVTTA